MPADSANPEALAFFEAAEKTLVYLKGRWLDERDYEHIDAYMQPLSSIAENAGVLLTAMTKRPFGIQFRVRGKVFHAYLSGRSYAYKRIS